MIYQHCMARYVYTIEHWQHRRGWVLVDTGGEPVTSQRKADDIVQQLRVQGAEKIRVSSMRTDD